MKPNPTPLERYRKKLERLSVLHKNLCAYRKQNKLNQGEMAALLGLTRGKYRSYEYGIAEPSLKAAFEIAKKLNIELNELVGGELKQQIKVA